MYIPQFYECYYFYLYRFELQNLTEDFLAKSILKMSCDPCTKSVYVPRYSMLKFCKKNIDLFNISITVSWNTFMETWHLIWAEGTS